MRLNQVRVQATKTRRRRRRRTRRRRRRRRRKGRKDPRTKADRKEENDNEKRKRIENVNGRIRITIDQIIAEFAIDREAIPQFEEAPGANVHLQDAETTSAAIETTCKEEQEIDAVALFHFMVD
jgi:hypothetical protein